MTHSRKRLLWYGLMPGMLVLVGSSLPLPRQLEIVAYAGDRVSVYSNRNYVNTLGHAALLGLEIVRLPRHHQHDIRLRSETPLVAYRFLCDRNQNASFDDWRREPVEVFVKGNSCTFREVVSRELPAGEHRLTPGGPKAAAPLLVRSGDPALRAHSLFSFNRIYPPWLRTSDGVAYHTSRKTLLGWLLVYGLICVAAALRIEARPWLPALRGRPVKPAEGS